MALPKISQPIYSITIPSNGKEIKIRPFTVKEEKLLMMAKQSLGNGKDSGLPNRKMIADLYRQMITNCVVQPDNLDADELASFDIEYIFIQLRAKSVSNIVQASVIDEHGQSLPVELNLDDVKVGNIRPKKERSIMLTTDLGVVLKYPTFNTLLEMEELAKTDKTALVGLCIESVFDNDSVYPFSEASKEEIKEFIESLGPPQLEKISPFFSEFPTVSLEIKFRNSKGDIETKTLQGLDHFFG